MHVIQLAALEDNYIHLLVPRDSKDCIIVDATTAKPVIEYCTTHKLTPRYILTTHHHADHVSGNLELKSLYGCRILGSSTDRHRIPGLDQTVGDGDELTLLGLKIKVITCPGHTTGAVTYFLADAQPLAFTGDTLFTMGCGRLFEGTPEEMWLSLNKLKEILPRDTLIYCGHEYTLKNTAFARAQHPSPEIEAKWQVVLTAHKHQKSTVPSVFAEELRLNPFLTAGNAAEFAKIRALRDQFRLEPPPALG